MQQFGNMGDLSSLVMYLLSGGKQGALPAWATNPGQMRGGNPASVGSSGALSFWNMLNNPNPQTADAFRQQITGSMPAGGMPAFGGAIPGLAQPTAASLSQWQQSQPWATGTAFNPQAPGGTSSGYAYRGGM